MPYLDVLTRNLHVGKTGVREIDTLIRQTKPDVVSLQECRDAAPAIIAYAHHHGWAIVAEHPAGRVGDERGDTILLLAPHVTVRWRRISVMRLRWYVASHHRWHDPRRTPRAGIVVRGQRWRISAAHWATGWARNLPAFVEAMTKAGASLVASGRNPAIEVGDLNAHGPTLPRFVRRAGLHLRTVGVDGVLSRRCHVVSVRNLGKHGSDHDSFLFRIATN